MMLVHTGEWLVGSTHAGKKVLGVCSPRVFLKNKKVIPIKSWKLSTETPQFGQGYHPPIWLTLGDIKRQLGMKQTKKGLRKGVKLGMKLGMTLWITLIPLQSTWRRDIKMSNILKTLTTVCVCVFPKSFFFFSFFSIFKNFFGLFPCINNEPSRLNNKRRK